MCDMLQSAVSTWCCETEGGGTLTSSFAITEDHIRECDMWVKVNGPITHSNFIACFLDVLRSFEITIPNVKAILSYVLDEGNIQYCSHCGRIPAIPKNVNGRHFLLCRECRDSILFHDLGPREGYT